MGCSVDFDARLATHLMMYGLSCLNWNMYTWSIPTYDINYHRIIII